MNNCCGCHSEISRDGSGQLSRYLKALDPSFAPIDDRSIEDLLVFTKRYASQIRFYDIPGSHISEGEDPLKISWREFFRRDMAVIAASIAVVDLNQFRKDYDELRLKLEAHPSHNSFGNLFDPILGMLTKIDKWYSLAIPENPVYNDLHLAIESTLKEQAQKIMAYDKGFNYVDPGHPLHLDISNIENKNVWGIDGDGVNADISIYEGANPEEKIRHAALFVDDIFNSFYGFLTQLVQNSEAYMHFALEQYPSHQPHMALFIAFLKLFKLAQEQMNGLTGRLLDFYYKDVLHLQAKSSIPDKVHIVFELAKDVAEYDITQGTKLKAGKDAAGNEQIYTTNNDLVVNQAKVKELKNIFIETEAPGDLGATKKIQAIYARPVANSRDGFGEKFPVPNSKWPTFGRAGNVTGINKNLCNQIASLDELDRKDQAQVGFALASPQLVLQGGNRLITLQLSLLKNPIAGTDTDDLFLNTKILLTGKDQWLEIDSEALEKNRKLGKFDDFIRSAKAEENFHKEDFKADFVSGYLINKVETDNTVDYIIDVYLPVSEQPVIAFEAKLHPGYAFKTTHPVMQLVLDNRIQLAGYASISINKISLNVQVGSINKYDEADDDVAVIANRANIFINDNPKFDGLKTLVLQNDNGLIEPDKPFDPFTAYPKQGSSLYIGSNEIFNKPVQTLSINILLMSEAGNDVVLRLREGKTGYLRLSILEKKQWASLSRKNGNDFTFNSLTQNILFKKENTESGLPLILTRAPITYNTELKNDTDKGFIRIENGLAYQREGNKGIFELMQELSQVLKIKEISLSYHADLDQFEAGIDQLFHVYPFGVVETYIDKITLGRAGVVTRPAVFKNNFSDLDAAKDFLLIDAKRSLLPQFNFLNPYTKYYSTNKASEISKPALFGRLRTSTDDLGNTSDRLIEAAGNNVAAKLMLEASSIREKTQGFANQYSGVLQEGMLFIGLENLKPLQSVSMLFQFAEGSAENEDDDPPVINWSYLTNNEWRPLKAEYIVSDGTYGFQTTGIIKIDVPADASAHNTIITDGLIWFSAGVTEHAERIPQLIDVVTQAVEATFSDQGNDQSHFDKALAPGSISKLDVAVAEVSKVQQPFASFDGKHKEVGSEYYTRVSERLRHKGRAINSWDYEHLVLDRFPSIYKVKCITHTDPNCLCRHKATANSKEKKFLLCYNADSNFDAESLTRITAIAQELKTFLQLKAVITAFAPDGILAPALAMANRLAAQINADGSIDGTRITTGTSIIGTLRSIEVKLAEYAETETETCCGPQVAPGHVLIVPIANLKNRNSANPLQPKTSRRTLLAIQDYLKRRTSAFVKVHAKNPVYEQIIVSFKVKFYSGTDKGFYLKKLNDEIVHFLTPWAFDETAEVKFDQKIYASSIINFIEERSYVDFITDFIMGVCCDSCCAPATTNKDTEIEGTIKDSSGKPLSEVVISQKGINSIIKSDDAGLFKLTIPETSVVTLGFTLSGYENQQIIVGKNIHLDVVLYTFSEMLDHICSCKDVEWLLQSDATFEGDIVAKPCTARSILVSVPHHIIVPYEPPVAESLCEKRQKNRLASSDIFRNINPPAVKKVPPKKTVPKKTPAKKAAPKK